MIEISHYYICENAQLEYFIHRKNLYQTHDFIEGKQTSLLIEKYGFPKDKLLFAGLVNGKNIWKNHYARTLEVLDELKKKGINKVLSHRQRM